MQQPENEDTRLLDTHRRTAIIDSYQSVIRFMAREDFLKKLLIYLSSESFNHGADAGFFAKLKNHLHFICRTAGLPQLSELTLRRIAISGAFADSIGVLTEKVWPTVLAVLLLHDGITYFTQPLDRSGMILFLVALYLLYQKLIVKPSNSTQENHIDILTDEIDSESEIFSI